MPELLFAPVLISPYYSLGTEVRLSMIISLQIGSVSFQEQNNLNTKQQQSPIASINIYMHSPSVMTFCLSAVDYTPDAKATKRR